MREILQKGSSIPVADQPVYYATDNPVDTLLTRETRALWLNLKMLRGKGILFGQQDANILGVDWKYDADKSDVHMLTGTHPALYGYELSGIGNEVNMDSVPFEMIRQRMIEVFVRGGVNTATWHLNNPVSGGTAWDVTPAAGKILPDSGLSDFYKSELKKIAVFLSQVKDRKWNACTCDIAPLS